MFQVTGRSAEQGEGGRRTESRVGSADVGPPSSRSSATTPTARGPRTSSTDSMAARSSVSQSSACCPTSRTAQTSASDRERATPASTRVSSTSRSRCRSRVITGIETLVKISLLSPQDAPQATERP